MYLIVYKVVYAMRGTLEMYVKLAVMDTSARILYAIKQLVSITWMVILFKRRMIVT